ncbi:hypothetical protein [Paenibacillus residui]|uniref:Cache domain-containing protein n=1 Tax=Paenibacillus residui TaxID=629724 RepID=A0ABW3DEI1_9BACL
MKRLFYRYFSHLRFKHKLFLSYLTVILIPVSVLGAYAFNQSRAMLELQALQGIEKNVNTISESIGSAVGRYSHAVRSIVYNKIFQKIVSNDYIDLVNLSRDLKEYLTPYFIMMTNLDKDIEKVTFYTHRYVPEYGDSVLSASRVEREYWYADAIGGAGNQTHWFYDEGLFVTGTFPDLSAERKDIVYMRINETSFFKNVAELAQEYGVVIADSREQVIYSNLGAANIAALDVDNMSGLNEGMISAGETELFLVKTMGPRPIGRSTALCRRHKCRRTPDPS